MKKNDFTSLNYERYSWFAVVYRITQELQRQPAQLAQN
jgi:hypothetical protein